MQGSAGFLKSNADTRAISAAITLAALVRKMIAHVHGHAS